MWPDTSDEVRVTIPTEGVFQHKRQLTGPVGNVLPLVLRERQNLSGVEFGLSCDRSGVEFRVNL